MKSVEESAVVALDGTDKELFPYLPCILQDLWEIGSDPDVIIEAVRKHKGKDSDLQLLDLGCGKGAVSIRVAEELGCNCFGIDAIEEFIREAKKKASEHRVDELCTFAVGDIRVMIDTLTRHDVIVLGSIGPVFGDYFSTLTNTSRVLENNGIIIVDDGYIPTDSDYTHPQILRRDAILEQIGKAGMRLIDEIIIQQEDIKSSDDYIFGKIEKRCNELIYKHLEKRHLFEGYIKKQQEENDVLENHVICSTMIIKRQEQIDFQEEMKCGQVQQRKRMQKQSWTCKKKHFTREISFNHLLYEKTIETKQEERQRRARKPKRLVTVRRNYLHFLRR